VSAVLPCACAVSARDGGPPLATPPLPRWCVTGHRGCRPPAFGEGPPPRPFVESAPRWPPVRRRRPLCQATPPPHQRDCLDSRRWRERTAGFAGPPLVSAASLAGGVRLVAVAAAVNRAVEWRCTPARKAGRCQAGPSVDADGAARTGRLSTPHRGGAIQQRRCVPPRVYDRRCPRALRLATAVALGFSPAAPSPSAASTRTCFPPAVARAPPVGRSRTWAVTDVRRWRPPPPRRPPRAGNPSPPGG